MYVSKLADMGMTRAEHAFFCFTSSRLSWKEATESNFGGSYKNSRQLDVGQNGDGVWFPPLAWVAAFSQVGCQNRQNRRSRTTQSVASELSEHKGRSFVRRVVNTFLLFFVFEEVDAVS
jgi:hypothetical protein